MSVLHEVLFKTGPDFHFIWNAEDIYPYYDQWKAGPLPSLPSVGPHSLRAEASCHPCIRLQWKWEKARGVKRKDGGRWKESLVRKTDFCFQLSILSSLPPANCLQSLSAAPGASYACLPRLSFGWQRFTTLLSCSSCQAGYQDKHGLFFALWHSLYTSLHCKQNRMHTTCTHSAQTKGQQ